jgi:RND family efflux transporter MFP subunit
VTEPAVHRKPDELRVVLQILVPVAVLALAFLLAKAIAAGAVKPVQQPPVVTPPTVRVEVVHPADVRLDVHTQGNVEPLRTVELAAEVSGRIVATSPALRAGGAFAAGEVLIEIDRRDFELAIAQHEAALARAQVRVQIEKAEADAAVRAWKQLEGERAADPLVSRVPQIREADTALAAATAALAQAKLDLERTSVRVPFAGRVQAVAADLGQVVQRGQRLATVFDLSAVEVHLPISLGDAAFVDLPLASAVEQGPAVELTADFAGERHTWPARIVRTGSEVDRRTRQLSAIARAEAGRAGNGGADGGDDPPPLLAGMFVHARIAGRTFPGALSIPRAALRGEDEVWIVADGAAPATTPVLQRRRIEVLRAEAERVHVRSGLTAGDRVCVTALEAPTEGMRVLVAATEPGK